MFTPLQTFDTSVLTPESDTQDTEHGVTGRFITNQVTNTFQQQFQEQFKQYFHAHFQDNMNKYSDTLDDRIKHVVAEAMDDLFATKVIPHVKSSVNEMYDTINTATIESFIDDKIGDQIRTSMEQSSIAILEKETTTLSESVLNDIVKPEINTIVKSVKNELTRDNLDKLQAFKNTINSAKNEIHRTTRENVQEIQNQSRSITQVLGTFKTTYAEFARKAREDMKG